MAWIKMISEEQADGQLKDCYERYLSKSGGQKVANILKVQSLSPKSLMSHIALYFNLAFGEGPLKRYQREMIATWVSHTNECFY